jgi:nicotinamide-nucleotide amidase
MKRPGAEVLTIGNELLRGTVLNTNAQFLGAALLDLGFETLHQSSCADAIPEIIASLRRALSRSDVVIATGGLGPTPDDLTRDAVAGLFGVPLEISRQQLNFIKSYYRRRNKKMPFMVRKEAMFPKTSVPLFNHYGIALGFSITLGSKILIVLPGVPDELRGMFKTQVLPVLKKNFPALKKRHSLIVKTVGLSEPGVMERLKKDFFSDPFEFGIYPKAGEVALRLYADSPVVLARLEKKLRERLGSAVYAYAEKEISEAVGELLTRKKRSLAVAESCTGGLLAAELTRTPGASRYFLGSMTVYDNRIKELLGVPAKTISAYGAVSMQVAKLLASRVREKFGSDYGIGITGIAGPAGGSKKKPVGLVYLALAAPSKVYGWKESFWGNRSQIQTKAVKRALEYLWKEIR